MGCFSARIANLNIEARNGQPAGHREEPDARVCLFLDVDGTLLEFADSPEHVTADAELRTLLRHAALATDGAAAFVSGRSLAQIDHMFAPLLWPAAGLHGLERRDAHGRLHHTPMTPGRVDLALREFERLAAGHVGVEVENKGLAIALHYRRAPELEATLAAEVEQVACDLGGGYHVQPGSCVFEIKPVGATKADAVDAFLAEAPFAGRRPLYAGDDLTDLDAFAAVERAGGLSMAVGGRVQAMVNFPTVAHFRRYLGELVKP
jgi:trehalose 6-phosphate phosphatase